MAGEGLPEQSVGTDGNYLCGKVSVFSKIKVTGEVLPEQTVGMHGNYLYGRISVFCIIKMI
jgi:hypothetical protein